MRLLRWMFAYPDFSQLDGATEKLRKIRDSYRALNLEIYGEEIASLLNDW